MDVIVSKKFWEYCTPSSPKDIRSVIVSSLYVPIIFIRQIPEASTITLNGTSG